MAKKKLTWNQKQAKWAKQTRQRGFPDWLTEAKWNEHLDTMIEAFRLIIEEEDGPVRRYDKDLADFTRRDKGLALFGKWYMHLWD